MSNEKFTKGPWRWISYDSVDGFYGLYAGDDPVIYPQRRNDGDDGDAWFSMDESYYGDTALKPANAALIAASPEMYDMLKKVADELLFMIRKANSDIMQSVTSTTETEPDYYDEQTVFEIMKLLAKARGE